MYLDSHVKGEIVKAALEYGFGKRIEALRKEHAAIAAAIWNDNLGKHKRALAKLPEGLVSTQTYVGVVFGGKRTSLYFAPKFRPENTSHARWWSDFEGDRRWWFKGHDPRYQARHPLAVRWEKWAQAEAKLLEEWTALRAKLNASVARMRTVKRLLEEWPEAKKFIPKKLEKAAPLPAVPAPVLNALIEKARAA